MDRDEMGREQAHGGVVVMQVKEAAEPRKIRSFARPAFGKHLCAAVPRMPSARKGRAHK